MMTQKPVLFVPHGSPMFALEPGAVGPALTAAVKCLPAPRAVVVISPHWETEVPTVGFASQMKTIHDFGGFDARLYDIDYPATGCPEAAKRVLNVLTDAGFVVDTDQDRGLDHGAWVPLRYMFPDAEVPIVPLSMQHHGGPVHAYRIGQALSSLVSEGFLVVGSGNVTHNLRDWQLLLRLKDPTPDYVFEFSDWIYDRLLAKDVDSLLDYRQTQPAGRRAHPRDEHLLTLFTALGAAGKDSRPEAFYRGVSDTVIAMDGYAFYNVS